MRSFLFNIYFFTANFCLFLLCLPLLFFGKKGGALAAKIWGTALVYGAKYIAGISFEIRGEVPQKPVIYAAKHQSAWETMFFPTLAFSPVLVFKKELVYIPFFGLYLLAGGHILVDRKAGGSALKKMLRDIETKLASGRSVVIFPEGTRKKPGENTEIKSGIIAIYNNIKAPVIPVSLNSGEFWAKGAWRKKAGKIIVTFGNEIAKNLSREEFVKTLSQQITMAPEKKL